MSLYNSDVKNADLSHHNYIFPEKFFQFFFLNFLKMGETKVLFLRQSSESKNHGMKAEKEVIL